MHEKTPSSLLNLASQVQNRRETAPISLGNLSKAQREYFVFIYVAHFPHIPYSC